VYTYLLHLTPGGVEELSQKFVKNTSPSKSELQKKKPKK
jgi:hypothetical protein